MKNLLILITIMLVGGCATTPTVESVLGAYEPTVFAESSEETKEGGPYRKEAYRVVLLENGIVESYTNGKKEEEEWKWKIVDGKIHVKYNSRYIEVYRYNKDKSITQITYIRDGKRTAIPKEEQVTYKKIK